MRLTVGPLPSAVYWRRRAIVLGAAVVVIFLIVQSCSGGDASSVGNGKNGQSSAPAADPKPTVTILRPHTDPPEQQTTPQNEEPPPTNPAPRTGEAAPPPDDGSCTDAEMLITPVPEVTSAARGSMIAIRLRIKNTGKRTCSRDVGADQQELYIKKGAAKVWSSDTCGNVKGSDVQPFTPNFEREYRVDWNGKDVSKCADNLADGPVPAAGDYQVFGRLATKTSNPVKLTLN
ncbi:hypothetical protein SAMN05421812_113279 [Asanoa hainanensis]|uniref:Uncharacterized protein n=1 Tax=Asanoa hainanensis TaxID=560556 RepID=A0A239P4N4_9ACTN|nr:hypothetical protein [Asanoa hainanensis]SNT62025.1 hypothetical protein SAMN05421812_113279 [Asanoa hainanensis]